MITTIIICLLIFYLLMVRPAMIKNRTELSQESEEGNDLADQSIEKTESQNEQYSAG